MNKNNWRWSWKSSTCRRVTFSNKAHDESSSSIPKVFREQSQRKRSKNVVQLVVLSDKSFAQLITISLISFDDVSSSFCFYFLFFSFFKIDFLFRWDPLERLTPEEGLRHPWIVEAKLKRSSRESRTRYRPKKDENNTNLNNNISTINGDSCNNSLSPPRI